MPTVRIPRSMRGAEALFKRGRCWADAVLWVRSEGTMTLEDVGYQNGCGYCGGCQNG